MQQQPPKSLWFPVAVCGGTAVIGAMALMAAWLITIDANQRADAAERRAFEAESRSAAAELRMMALIDAVRDDVRSAKDDARAALSKYEIARAWQERIEGKWKTTQPQ